MSSITLTRPQPLKLTERLLRKLRNRDYRNTYVAESVKTWVARQIRTLREQRGWSQIDMGRNAGKPQSTISRLEDPDYGQMTVQTLLDLAAAFDVALDVRFVNYSNFLRNSRDFSTGSMKVSSFDVAALSAGTFSLFETNTPSTNWQSVGNTLDTDPHTEIVVSDQFSVNFFGSITDPNAPAIGDLKISTNAIALSQ